MFYSKTDKVVLPIIFMVGVVAVIAIVIAVVIGLPIWAYNHISIH